MPFKPPGPTSYADAGTFAGGNKEPSSEPVKPKEATPTIISASGENLQTDLRARIRFPANYAPVDGSDSITAIVFPYTPQISYDYKADYSAINTVHTNYTQFFYKNSSVGSINISARFTVQNAKEAKIYLATKHILAALTKMPYGGDFGAGSPPPVCRLDAYGPYMIKNVPVVITSFRVDFPQDVDYFDSSGYTSPNSSWERGFSDSLGLNPLDLGYEDISSNDANFVPMLSNFVIACQPLYSRREMLGFNVKSFVEDYKNNTKYL